MRKTCLSILASLISLCGFAQVTETATFDFMTPSSLNSSQTLVPETTPYCDVPVTDYTFTSGDITMSFDRGKSNGRVAYTTCKDMTVENSDIYYELWIGAMAQMKLTASNGAKITSVRISDGSIKGDMYVYMVDDVKQPTNSVTSNYLWSGSASSVEFAISNGSRAQLQKLYVSYTTAAEILTPTSVSLPSTTAKFSQMTLTFDRNMTVTSASGIKLSNGTALSATASGRTITLTAPTPVTTDGNYTITIPAGSFSDSKGYVNKALSYSFTVETPKLTPTTTDLETTTASFSQMTLTFSDDVTVASTKGIKLSDGTPLSVTANGNTVTLSTNKAITTDGTYTLTIPAGCIVDGNGYGNAALSYTFTVATPKDTYAPTSVSPADSSEVRSLTLPVTLTFNGAPRVVNATPTNAYIQQDGEDVALLSFAKSSTDNHSVVITSDSYPATITDSAKFTLVIPEGIISDGLGKTHNPAMTLTYYVGGKKKDSVTPDPTPDPKPDPTPEPSYSDSKVMKAAKQIVETYKSPAVGYPSTESASYKELAELTAKTYTSKEDSVTLDNSIVAAMGKYYKETEIVLPVDGKSYKIYAENTTGQKAYLQYDGEKVTLTSSETSAATFKAEAHDAAIAFKTSDGKYLHTLSTSIDYDGTSTDNVTSTYGNVSNITVGRLDGADIDSVATLGMVSLYGSLGKNLDTQETAYAYSRVRFGTSPAVASAIGRVVFTKNSSCAFRIVETTGETKPDVKTDTATVATEYTITPDTIDNKGILTLTFTKIDVLSVNSNVQCYIADSTGSKIESITPIKASADFVYIFQTSDMSNDTYQLVIPEGAFTYTLDGKTVKTQAITKKFVINDGSVGPDPDPDPKPDPTPDPDPDPDPDPKPDPTPTPDPTGVTFYDFDSRWSLQTYMATTPAPIKDVDFNDSIMFSVFQSSELGDLCVDTTKTVTIVYTNDGTVITTGHLKKVSINDYQWTLKLVVAEPFVENDSRLRQYRDYTVIVPEKTYGDANFGKYLNGQKVSSCYTNVYKLRLTFYVNNALATGIEQPGFDNSKPQVIYDLQGRRVERITRPGIYIVNGKKIVKK